MQLCGDLDVLSFVRVSLLIWIGHANRMDSNRRASQVFKINRQVCRLTGRSKTNGGTVYKDIIKAKLKTGKKGTYWIVVPF